MKILESPKEQSIFYANQPEASWAILIADIIEKSQKKLWTILFRNSATCELFYEKLEFFLNFAKIESRIKVLPPLSQENASAAFDALCERTGTLNAISACAKNQTEEKLIVLTCAEALFDKTQAPQNSKFLELSIGDKTNFENLRQKLVEFGYYNETVCENVGQFSVRGSIIDVYPIASSTPCRIDFFGNEIESIRSFDPNTQLTDSKLKRIRIDAVAENSESEESCAVDYILQSKDSNWIFVEPSTLISNTETYFLSPENLPSSRKSFARIFERKNDTFIAVSELETKSSIFENSKITFPDWTASTLNTYFSETNIDVGLERFNLERKARSDFLKNLEVLSKNGIRILLGCDSDGDSKALKRILLEENLKLNFFEISDKFGTSFVLENLSESSHWLNQFQKSNGLAFVSATQLLGRRTKLNLSPRRRIFSRRAQVDQLLDFSELSEGDYVVHLGHGICRYHGIQHLPSQNGGTKEAMKLEFEDGATLYLPLHNAHLVSRYIGLDKRHPKLSRLDSKSWTKIKSSAELATLDYAAELLDIESKREISKGFAFSQDDDWQKEFDDAFEYTETPDQLRAIKEIKEDMTSPRPMERLLCADVGFGKTEVAMRAAFKAAMSGKQIAVLCPTTILAQQHFRTFRERMSGYPVVIEMLSRFRTTKEASKIRQQLESGQIDILIGTHAILSDKVNFKDLGLLIIDEEHRFGVRHKEKIKRLKTSIDVLSMSATPIPRTLYFAMMGARKISLMETPPKNRFPVETSVREFSDDVVRKAVEQEISRGGQVFYLHNRVKTIESRAESLRQMFPNLRIAVGHGQMEETKLERLMANFVDGKFDILVCTTIIESGLDIPNCNTIIIEGADRFGLAQLYQLRGRVGRFTRRAYAWLLLHKHASIVESARKRLGAIRQYNKPGAGFRIATRDLQLRGCGNLLGSKQSGHIAGVGFDLYCALLKRSIALLRGEKPANLLYAKISLDFVELDDSQKSPTDISQAENYYQEIKMRETAASATKTLKAFISSDYIPQSQLRVDLYRKLAMVSSIKEVSKLKEETIDRFGKLPESVENCFILARIRLFAQEQNIVAVESEGANLKLRRHAEGTNYVRINGHFPRLTKSTPTAKLLEIENFLKNVLPSL